MSNETDAFPGPAEDVTTDLGMSVEDAATSAFDDADRRENGIAEGERESLGQHLKFHADSAGTTVIGGLNALIEPAVALRHGDLTTKREVIGNLIDQYDVRPVPEAEPAPEAVEYGQPAHDGEGQPIATEEQALDAVAQFAREHPGAQDELVVDHMTWLAHDHAPPRVPADPGSGLPARHRQRSAIFATGAASPSTGPGHRAPCAGEARNRPSFGRGKHVAQLAKRRS